MPRAIFTEPPPTGAPITTASFSSCPREAASSPRLATFNGTNGSHPLAAPIMDAAGEPLRNTANGGDANGDGTVFKVANGSGTITTLEIFTATDGAQPTGALAMDAAGNIYGATANGGTNGGTIYKLSLSTGPASQLAFGTPLTTTAGTLGNVINVVAEDSSGNIVSNIPSDVTLSLTSGPASLGGALTAPTINGVASFTDLTLNEASASTRLPQPTRCLQRPLPSPSA